MLGDEEDKKSKVTKMRERKKSFFKIMWAMWYHVALFDPYQPPSKCHSIYADRKMSLGILLGLKLKVAEFIITI